ncbi:hypothetical protein [Vibrio owensii]|uniref:hypothetical protein n=1 Tax=Vibrio owensii TaxID=696485 RepID=UPI003CC61383
MELVNLSELSNDEHPTGQEILNARAKANELYPENLVHFQIDESLYSFPEHGVIFLSSPEPYILNRLNHDGKSMHRSHIYQPIIQNGESLGSWDGKCIFSLIELFQHIASIKGLNRLIELVQWSPVALQSKRLTGSQLTKAKAGIEFSKLHHFYIDQQGIALVAVCFGDMYFRRDESDQYAYFLCSEAKLPELIALCKQHKVHNSRGSLNDISDDWAIKVDINSDLSKIKSAITPSPLLEKGLGHYDLTPKQLRHVLSYHSNDYVKEADDLAYTSGIPLSKLSSLLEPCIEQGFLETIDPADGSAPFDSLSSQSFASTVKGNAACMKTNLKRMSSRALDKKKMTIESRYLEAHELQDHLYRIPVVLGYFGSAIDNASEDYGDLDVLFLDAESPSAIEKYSLFADDSDYRFKMPYRYRNDLQELYKKGLTKFKPHQVDMYQSISSYSASIAKKWLQRRDRLISVHEFGEVLSIGAPFEVHFLYGKRLETPLTNKDGVLAALKREQESRGIQRA